MPSTQTGVSPEQPSPHILLGPSVASTSLPASRAPASFGPVHPASGESSRSMPQTPRTQDCPDGQRPSGHLRPLSGGEIEQAASNTRLAMATIRLSMSIRMGLVSGSVRGTARDNKNAAQSATGAEALRDNPGRCACAPARHIVCCELITRRWRCVPASPANRDACLRARSFRAVNPDQTLRA